MSHLFKMHYNLAKNSIRTNKGRSFLTCLGIAIGVASITLILSLAGSISCLIGSEISKIGPELIVVRPSSEKDTISSIIDELTTTNTFQNSPLTISDANLISNLENVSAVAPIATSSNTIITEKNTLNSIQILGTTPDYNKIESTPIKYGTFLSSQNSPSNKVILGRNLSLKLFNTLNTTVGKTVTVMGKKFIVVGVLDEIEDSINFDNVDLNEALIMDIENLSTIVPSTQIQQINVKAANTDSLDSTATTIKAIITANKQGDTNFTVSYGNDITHPSSNLFSTILGILLIIAAVSLIVGGIGIMNIMLVSVTERIPEIGIRKAVGASAQNILMQFLIEALILSIIGGIMGIILGYLLTFFISLITPFMPFISLEILLIAFLVTVFVGVIFGTYPAIKAATKNPIESLKHYR